MQKNFTKLIAHFLSTKRYTVPAGAFLLFLATSLYVWANVSPGSSTINVSADYADEGATPKTITGFPIGNIVIDENNGMTFQRVGGTQNGTIILELPAPATNWMFDITPGLISVNVNNGGQRNFNASLGTITTTSITINISNIDNANNRFDVLTISGVRVRPIVGAITPENEFVNITYGESINLNAGLANGDVFANLRKVPGVASKLAFVTQPSIVLTGDAITPAPQVAIQDQFGNTVTTGAGATTQVTLAIGTNPAGGTLNGTKTVTASGGVAIFPGLSIDAGGVGYTLTATSGTLTPTTSSTFNINSIQPTLNPIAETVCITVGAPAQEITLTGSNFARNAMARVGGSNRATTFVSSTELKMALPASDLTTAGNRTITVVNPGPTNSISSTQTLVVHNIFENVSISGDRADCTGETQTYEGPSSFTDYEWSVTEGASLVSESANSFRVRFDDEAPVSGKVTVTVTAKNPCGIEGTKSFDVIVTQSPTAELTAPEGTTTCAGSTVALEATPVEGATYQWLLRGSAVTGYIADNTYDADASGRYSVNVRNSNGCVSTSNNIVVTIYDFPTATITQGATATYCAGGSTILTAEESGAGFTYQWYLDDLAIGDETERTLEVSAAGDYTVEVFRNGCSTISEPTTVTELPLPIAEITPESSPEFCAGGTVVLNATPGDGYTFRWFAEGSSTVLDSDGSFTTSTPGNYYVEVTGANDCVATSASVAVVVNQPPVATITATGPADFCFGESVTLNAPLAPFGTDYSYEWYLDGSTTVIGISQSIEASESGTYTVKVLNSATGCESTSAGTVVREGTLEFAIFTYTGATEFCEGGSLQLNAILAPPGQTYTYQWTDGAGTTVGTNSTFTATTTGTYKVIITETSIEANNCVRTSDEIEVIVNPQPSADITGGAQSLCAEADNTTSFSVSGTFAGGSAIWSSSNANFVIEDAVYNTETGVATATVVATGSGDATISLTTSSTVEGCNEAADAVVLNVRPLPIATIEAEGETTFCEGGSVILTAPTGTGYTYQWYRNEVPVIGTGSSLTASLSGNYYVIVTSNDCPVQSPAVAVTVNPQPTAMIEVEGNLAFCEGGSVVLTAVSDIGTDFTWYRDGIEVGTGATYTANESGSYTLGASVDGTGCSNLSAATVVNVNATPDATITPLGETTFCDRESVTLQAPAAPDGQTYSYQWFNGTTQVGVGRTYQAATGGNYTVRVTNSSTSLNCSATTATPVVVTVNPLPVASISYPDTAPTTFCQGGSLLLTGVSSTGPSSYIWYRNNEPIAGATGATYAATETGSYTVRATDGNTCTGDMSAAVQVTVNPSITGNSIAGAQTVCSRAPIAALGQAPNTTLSGGATPYGYQWQVSTNNSTWNDLTTGGNAASYTPPVQTVTASTTTYYRRIVSGGGCSSTSASVAVTVTPLPTLNFTGTLASTSTFYTGQSAVALTASPAGGTFSGPGVSGSVSTGFTFNPCAAGAGSRTITYTYESTSGAQCSNSIFKPVTVVPSKYTVVVTTNNFPVCRGENTDYTAQVYRDIDRVIYPYMTNAQGQPVNAQGQVVADDEDPAPNPEYINNTTYVPANTPEIIKQQAYRFFEAKVILGNGAKVNENDGQDIKVNEFTYRWTRSKSDGSDIGNDARTRGFAGLSATDWVAVWVSPKNAGTTTCSANFDILSSRIYFSEPRGYTMTLSPVAPWCYNPADQSNVTLTANLGALSIGWDATNVRVDWYIKRSGVADRIFKTTTGATGSTLSITEPRSTFQNGDQVYVIFTSDFDTFADADSKCTKKQNITQAITIQIDQPASISASIVAPAAICVGGSTSFTVNATGTNLAYQWYKDGAALSNVNGVTGATTATLGVTNATLASGGNYYVVVRNATTSACSTEATSNQVTLVVNAKPTATLAANDATTKCFVAGGTPFSLTGTTTGGTEAWTIVSPTGGATAAISGTGATRLVTVAGTGSVTVRLTSTNPSSGCSTATQNVVLTVNPQPTATLAANDATTKCFVAGGTTFSLTGTTTGGTEAWTIVNPTGGATAAISGTGSNRTVTVAGTGSVTVRLTSTNPNSGCTQAIREVVLTVNPLVTIIADDMTSDPEPVMIGEAATFGVNTNLGEGVEVTYTWYIGDEETAQWRQVAENTVTSPTNSFTLNPVEPGEFDVRVDITPVNNGTVCYNTTTVVKGEVTPLPVEIIYLNAVKEGNNVVLEWATAMEEDNTGFEVQVSTDGFNYRLLTFVPAKNGNSSTKQEYEFTDKENGKSGTRYYRLKQIDTNGTYEFFGPKAVTFGSVASKVIAFPNPFHDEVTLDIAAEVDGEALITVTDAVGKQLLERKVQVQKGFTTEKLRLDANLPRGLYIIKAQVGGITQYIKMIKE